MITKHLKDKLYRREPVFSFEFFPPKTSQGEETLRRELETLVKLDPTFVSVTYGAGGTTREKTRELVRSIQEQYGLTTMAHLTCVGATNGEIEELLEDYHNHGITNILALRGDAPEDEPDWKPTPGGPQFASDLVKLAHGTAKFSVGVAGFPEKHPEAPDLETDLRFLAQKVDAGADFVITQLFFNNDVYFEFVRRARKAGVTIPIIPGVMPITRVGQIQRFHELSGCAIPETLLKHLKDCGDDEERVQEIGLAYCAGQSVDLLRRGAPGLHFYTLNKSRACQTIYAALHSLGIWNA